MIIKHLNQQEVNQIVNKKTNKMKKIIYLLIIFFSITTFSQNYNSIKISNLKINGFSFNQTQNSLISILGSPDNITNYYYELEDEVWVELIYNDNSFYFENDNLIEFCLKDNSYYFQNPNIIIGGNILNLEFVFPLSFNNKRIIDNKGFIRVNITLDNNEETDMFIIINYDKITKIITSIRSSTS